MHGDGANDAWVVMNFAPSLLLHLKLQIVHGDGASDPWIFVAVCSISLAPSPSSSFRKSFGPNILRKFRNNGSQEIKRN